MARNDLESFSELGQYELDPSSIRLLPMIFCQRHNVAVLGSVRRNSQEPVVLGMLHPENTALCARVGRILRRPIRPVQLNLYEINKAIQTGFTQFEETDYTIRFDTLLSGPNTPVPQLLDAILADAVERQVSDVHIESYHNDVDLRYRIDGILHQVFTHLTPDNIPEFVSRIKVLASLDISERRRPQDGRFSCRFIRGDERWIVDFRVSVVPSPSGEDVVLRVLDSGAGLLDLEDLGMTPKMAGLFMQLLTNPEGLILVTGPTGSGKTTTLYAALKRICDGNRKIITAEDPIEYYIPKINQKQTSHVMSMGDLLRAMLRQDPDVMLFGEIRDRETGDTALMAAATGHVVLGTLHTADSLGAVVRLRGLGLEDTDIATTLLAVLAQRLVRKLCPKCKALGEPSTEHRDLFGDLIDPGGVHHPVGCDHCHNTGYKGRIGLFELLLVDETLQDLIGEGTPKVRLRRHASSFGFKTMVHDGMLKVHRGLTSLDELVRVLPYRDISTARINAQQDAFRE